MLVSHRHRFIFIHTYKTAGMSMRRALDSYAEGRARRWVAKYARRLRLPAPATPRLHMPAREVRALLSPEVFDNYFTFAFVRNPWDWQVSLYHYMLKATDHYQHELAKSFAGFDAYIRWRVDKEVRLQKAFVTDEDCQVETRLVDLTEDLDLIMIKDCDPSPCGACQADSATMSNADECSSIPLDLQDNFVEKVNFDTLAGQAHIVVVDGYDYSEGTYTLEVDCVCG